jgi:cytochrome b6-f complex iron-sulfur subunit
MTDDATDRQPSFSSRRALLKLIWAGLGVTIGGQVAIITYRFLAPREGVRIGNQLRAGRLDAFPPRSVTFISEGSLFLVRLADGGVVALSNRCPHLGCTVIHDADRDLLACSCHASTFRHDGQVLNPPATRPLDWFKVGFDQDDVIIDLGVAQQRTAVEADDVAYPPGARG